MIISILSIGNDILNGKTSNTNELWIPQRLTNVVCTVNLKVSVPDKKSNIISSLSYILNFKPNYIIVTGGLGPTSDDITREVIFEFIGIRDCFFMPSNTKDCIRGFSIT